MKETIGRNRDTAIILALFVALALAYSVVNPLHEATDELRHYRYVRFVATQGRLPVQGQEACRTQSHHPPLFYALGAVLTGGIDTGRDLCATPPHNPFWAYRYADVGVDNKNQYLHGPDEAFPWHGEALAAHLLRILNVVFGAGTVWLTWAAGRAIWPGRRALAAGAAALVAFNPMFLYMSGAINNDVVAACSGAAVLLACVRLLRDEHGLSLRWGAIMGALYALALMSKFNMAVVGALIALTMTVVAWRRKQWRVWWRAALVAAVVTALLAGWWFVRNQLLYGEPTGFRTVTELWGVRDPRQSLPLAILELPLAWSTLWGRFGFGQIPLPAVIYDGLALLVGLGLLGAAYGGLRRDGDAPRLFLALLALNVLLAFAVLFNYMLVSPAGAMGRFFFPGLPALALLVFYGLYVLMLAVMQRARRSAAPESPLPDLLALGVNGGMLFLALIALFGYLAPAYALPPSYPLGMTVPNEINAQFQGLATLRGYELSRDTARPGDTLRVDLYWDVETAPVGNFLLFLHVMDNAGTMVAQRDTHPGTGTFPTGQWQAGDHFVDTVSVMIPETAYTPETLTVSVGFYAPTYRLAVADASGKVLGDSLILGTLALLPADTAGLRGADVPNPLLQNVENELYLRGYAYEQRRLARGEALAATFYWQRAQTVEQDYVARLQLLTGDGDVRAETESILTVASWPAETLQDVTVTLPLPKDLAPGAYGVRLILHDPVGDSAHHLIAPEGQIRGEYLDLAGIVIEAQATPGAE